MNGNYLTVNGLSPEKNKGIDNYNILKLAVEKCISSKYAGIFLPEGEYEVYNEKALDLYNSLMCGDISATDYDRWNAEHHAAFDISNVSGIEICGGGDGTIMKFNGLIAPFDFNNCENVKLKNIKIDWITVPYTPVTVVKKDNETIYVTPMEGYSLKGGEPIVSTTSIDPATLKQTGMAMYSDISNLQAASSENVYCFTCPEPEIVTVGEILILRHIYGFAPAIHFYRCKEISMDNITIHAVPGMGIVAQKSENIAIKNLSVKPSNERLMSSNCDATHFIACKGNISVKDSCFEKMGDDVINVHSFYLIIEKIEGNRLYLKQYANSQDGVPYIPSIGDDLEILNRNSLKKYKTVKAKEVSFVKETGLCCVAIDKQDVPDISVGDAVFDSTETATLDFTNCIANNIRGRGVLFSMNGAVIKNNKFINCTGEGVLLPSGGEPWWEAKSATNVEICNNEIVGCGNCQEKYRHSCGITVHSSVNNPANDIFKNIKIYDNIINGDICPMWISYADNVVVYGNEITSDKGIIIDNCGKIEFKP